MWLNNCLRLLCRLVFFFFNDTATTEIYTLSLHDALPISPPYGRFNYLLEQHSFTTHPYRRPGIGSIEELEAASLADRKSTRLNSSHLVISYAVFCLKKKKIRGHQSMPTLTSAASHRQPSY